MDQPKPPERVVFLPSVQLVGAQKAGTSAVANWLFRAGGFRRPKVFPGEPPYYSKEVHFFDIDHRFCNGTEFYSQRFFGPKDGATPERTLDATPDTLQFPQRVSQTYINAGGSQKESLKIIVILREPIARELSLYNHLAYDCRNLDSSQRNGWHNQVLRQDSDGVSEIMSFQQFVRDHSLPALKRIIKNGRSSRYSLYADHLKAWFQAFSREQILILSYDELSNHPERLQQRIQSFLGFKIPGAIQRGANSNESQLKVRAPTPSTLASLQSVFQPENEKLYKLLHEHPGRPEPEQYPFPKFGGYAVTTVKEETEPLIHHESKRRSVVEATNSESRCCEDLGHHTPAEDEKAVESGKKKKAKTA